MVEEMNQKKLTRWIHEGKDIVPLNFHELQLR